MKKSNSLKIIIVIVLLTLMSGCKTIENKTIEVKKNTIRNPKCEDAKRFKVYQVFNNFVLASICEDRYNSGDNDCSGYTVYFKKEKGKIYYDNQIIKVKKNECAIYIGTYRYKTAYGNINTVPIVKITNSQISNKE